MKAPSMWLDLVTWTVAWVDACCFARTCPCSERTEIAWSRVEQRMRFRSSTASWSQPSRISSGRLQRRPRPSSRFVCRAVRSNRHLVTPRKWHRRRRRSSFRILPSWMLSRVLIVRLIPLDRPFVPLGKCLGLEESNKGVEVGHGGTFRRGN